MVNEAEFRSRHFDTKGIAEPAARVPAGYKPRQNQRELVHSMWRTLDAILQSEKEKAGRSKSIERMVEDECDIQYGTYKKYMGLKRPVTRLALAKFAVGLGLPLDAANNLFRLQGGELNETNDFDYITIHALTDKDNVWDFQDELKRYTEVSSNTKAPI